tara:strand:- start:11034 stop:12323 length:1290 start_codon:yes stop_codon:yes gene_type:complete
MNEYDSNRIFDVLKKIGYSKTENISETDCYILNTCHIREKATEKVYHDVGRLKKEFKNRKKPILIVTGCVAQAEGEEMLKRENYIDSVIGPQSYHKISKIIKDIEAKKQKINVTEFDTIEKFDTLNLIKNSNSKVSSFLTIQEGCDKFCNFCVVPYTRGPEYSRTVSEILEEAKVLVENGSKEITLLGQNVNAYLNNKKKLSDLIYTLSKIKGLERIRYTTSHPKDMTDDLIGAHKDIKKLMPILHLPVQTGSTKILKLMNRKHNIEEYYNIIEKLKKFVPNIKFSSDFIIGYPGETDKDFNDTLRLMKKVQFINSYSFVFSARPGTPAAKKNIVKDDISKQRLSNFQELSEKIKINYKKKLLDSSVEVLFENRIDENSFFGRDKFFNSVIVKSNKNLNGKILNVKIKNFNTNTLFGTISDFNEKPFAA